MAHALVGGAGCCVVVQEPAGDGDNGEAPWHDQTIPIASHMKRRELPLRRRMMAAMAQRDCQSVRL